MGLRGAELLLLALIQREVITILAFPENNVVISSSDDFDDYVAEPLIAALPSDDDLLHNAKNKKSIRKRSTGRAVNIPYDVVEKMAKTPISELSPNRPDIQKEILDAHNKFRCKANPTASNMLKMVWSSEAQKTAEKWAKQCKVGHSPATDRVIPRFKCGENIFLSSFLVPWETVVDAWHSECADYKYGYGATSPVEVGHYTQVMWGTSYLMGCGMAECEDGPNKYGFVCHYGPAGNKGGRQFPYKEGKPCGDCPNSCENNLCTNPCGYQDFFKNCPGLSSGCVVDKSMEGTCPATCMCTKGEIK